MAKPRIIIADADFDYIIPLQLKFVEEFFEKIDLEIITDRAFFEQKFSVSQRADILVISEDLYDRTMQRHNVSHIFLLTEQYEEESTADLNVNRIFKYTSIKEIFNEIISKSSSVLKLDQQRKQETQVVLVYSASGGTGKTTVAMGISTSLTKNYKKVLYINAARLQTFQNMLENETPVTAADVYAKLRSENLEKVYEDIKHVLRKELFYYLPPFKAALMSLGLRYSVFGEIVKSAKRSGDFDFIVVDADVTFDEAKADLINMADRVVIVTNQSTAAVSATNILASNINGMNTDKYIFVCNDFDKMQSNALISPRSSLKFTISDYVDHFNLYEQMNLEELAGESSIQRVAFLII